MRWMHTIAAHDRYGDYEKVEAAINRGEVSIDDGLPIEGEFAMPSEHYTKRLALVGGVHDVRISHAMHRAPKSANTDMGRVQKK